MKLRALIRALRKQERVLYLDVSGSMSVLSPARVDRINVELAVADRVFPFTLKVHEESSKRGVPKGFTSETRSHVRTAPALWLDFRFGGGTDLNAVADHIEANDYKNVTVITDVEYAETVKWPRSVRLVMFSWRADSNSITEVVT